MKQKEIKNESVTSDFVDAADVRGMFLYRKDGYIMCYLRVYAFNLDLVSREDRRGKTDNMASVFKKDGKDFVYCSLPREIDLDKYKETLKKKYREAEAIGKRHILAMNMEECAELTTNGENYEHQHFVRIWKYGKDRSGAESSLKDRITDFENMYHLVGIKSEILQEPDIVKLCNLFGNSLQAGFENVEKSTLYTPILQM